MSEQTTSSESSPILIAQELLSLVTAAYSLSSDSSHGSLDNYQSKQNIVDVCHSLLRAVQSPEEYTALLAESSQVSSALQFATSFGIADLIASSPTGSLSLDELCEKVSCQRQHLGAVMSALVHSGYFIETEGFASMVYANNNLSDTLRSEGALPDGKVKSMKDFVGLSTDEAAISTTRLRESALSQDVASKIAIKYSQDTIFEWFTSPGNEWRVQRLNRAMMQWHRMANANLGVDYPWERLSTPIIDIGGGIGSLEMNVLSVPKNRELTFKIFDLEKTVLHAQKAWNDRPSDLKDRVSFVAGDFLRSIPAENKIPIPADGAGTYVISHVLHDWNEDQVVQILKNVRNAMLYQSPSDPTSSLIPKLTPRLLVIEMLLKPESARFVCLSSLQVLALSGGVTRTEADMRRLAGKAGFVVEGVKGIRGVTSIIEMIPLLE